MEQTENDHTEAFGNKLQFIEEKYDIILYFSITTFRMSSSLCVESFIFNLNARL